jgi:hypothetical protein
MRGSWTGWQSRRVGMGLQVLWVGRFTAAGAGTALRDGLLRPGKEVREP